MPIAAMAFHLGDMERKLLRLALSPSAQGGEITTSAIKLIEALRARGVESSELENALEGNGTAEAIVPVASKPDWGLTRMPWGQHKGSMLMDIPFSYLRWALRTWQADTPGRKELLEAIKNFLNQGREE
jgi:uncharacterized protein (DUF3820 family)